MLMKTTIARLSTQLLVAVVTFTTGVALAMLFVVPRFSTKKTPPPESKPSVLNEMTVPSDWQPIDFDNKLVLILPPDMKPAQTLGDMARSTKAYSNSEIHLTIIGDVLFTEWKEALKQRKTNSCDGPEIVTKHPTFSESFLQIDGRPAKLGIARGQEFGGIHARVCFPGADDDAFDFLIAASCKDDRALQIAGGIFSSLKFKR